MRIDIIETVQEHIEYLAPRMRKADNDECLAASGHTAAYCVQDGFERSKKCLTGLVNDEPTVCFGVTDSVLSCLAFTAGVPWLLGTDKVYDVKQPFLRRSIKYVHEMAQGYDVLENWVDARNELSIKWLQWCGFVIQKPAPFGVERRMFHRFFMINHVKGV